MLVNSKGRYLTVGVGLTSQEIDKPTLHSILNLISSGHFGVQNSLTLHKPFWGEIPVPNVAGINTVARNCLGNPILPSSHHNLRHCFWKTITTSQAHLVQVTST